ncbi:MAG: hypothetical protein OSB29_03485 [Verrucomicrobiota bacterium]|nr:hypothetical protein [Verrucomicrobiota bacterium]
MLAQPGAPATGVIPGAPITPVPGAAAGGVAPIPGATGSVGTLPGMAVTPQPGGVGLPTGLPGGAGTVNIPTSPTIDPSSGIPVLGAGGGGTIPGIGLPGGNLPGIGVPGAGGAPTGLPPDGSTLLPPGGVSTNQVPQPIINAAIMAEAMRVFQAEAKLIQAEANGKFTGNVKLDKWDKKTRQVRQQHNLAVLYTMGVGVPLDFRSAYKWFKIAADEGLPEAQLNVGIALQSGMGVKKDYVGAYKYYTLAAARGLPTAAPARDNLAQFLSQFQIRAGQRMAQGFKHRLDAKQRYELERKQAEVELYEALGRKPPGSN